MIDSHVHLDVEEFAADRAAVLERARKAGITGFVVPAIRRDTWPALADLASRESDVLPAYGLHPMFVSEHTEADAVALREWLRQHPAIAVGEIGLDAYVPEISDGEPWAKQQHLLGLQLDIAKEFELPVILHARRAVDQVLKALRMRPGLTGIVHSFAGSRQQADQLLDLGFCLGFGGPVTYPRAQKLRKLVAELPDTAFVLETDAPDQPSNHHRGTRNEPCWLPEIAACIAELRREPPDHIVAQSDINTRRTLKITPPKKGTE